MDIHRGIVKLVDDETHHDFELNNTEYMVVGTDRSDVLGTLQKEFIDHYKRYGKLEEKGIMAWTMKQGRHGKGCRGSWQRNRLTDEPKPVLESQSNSPKLHRELGVIRHKHLTFSFIIFYLFA